MIMITALIITVITLVQPVNRFEQKSCQTQRETQVQLNTGCQPAMYHQPNITHASSFPSFDPTLVVNWQALTCLSISTFTNHEKDKQKRWFCVNVYMCVCDKRGDTVRWWDIRTKPVPPHQLTQYCTKRYTSTSTHSTLHKKIHYPHINPHKATQKDTLLHQLTEHYTKRYTTPTSTHTILHKKIHCPDQLTLYTKRKTADTAHINSHKAAHIWFASLVTTEYTTNFYRLRLHTWWCHDSAQHKAHGAAFYVYFVNCRIFARVQYYNV